MTELTGVVIALIALVQPWLWAAYRRWIRVGKLEIYESGDLRLGYTEAGPTIRVWGTLRALMEDVFIQRLDIKVLRLADNATCDFGWVAFHGISLHEERSTPLTFPHSFNLPKAAPYVYSISFAAMKAGEQAQPILARVRNAWSRLGIDDERRAALAARGNLGPGFANGEYSVWDDFVDTPLFNKANAQLQEVIFWKPGAYRLTLRASLVKHSRPVLRTWRFSVSDHQAESLRSNSLSMLYEVCGKPSEWPSAFVHVDYESQQAAT